MIRIDYKDTSRTHLQTRYSNIDENGFVAVATKRQLYAALYLRS